MSAAAYRDDCNRIVIMNPKGGCGKTTLATNLASCFAARGPTPQLIDADPNGYATHWLRRRPAHLPRIEALSVHAADVRRRRSWSFRRARDAGAVIIDSPAGVTRREIAALTSDAACILVPVLPSAFDIDVTTRFIAGLLLFTDLNCPIGVVANRTRRKTTSVANLEATLSEMETPTVSVLRNTQLFVQAAFLGIGIHELKGQRTWRDVESIHAIIDWLDGHMLPHPKSGLITRWAAANDGTAGARSGHAPAR